MTRRHLRSASLAILALTGLGAYGCVADPPQTIIITGGDGSTSDGAGGATTTTTAVTTATTGSGGASTVTTGATTTGATTTTTTTSTSTTSTTGSGAGQPTGTFDLTIDDASPSSDLMDDTSITVTLTPDMGFVGAVALSVGGLPDGVTADFDDAAPTISSGAVTTHLNLHVDPSATVDTTSFTISAFSSSPPVSRAMDATITVNPSITLHIPQDVLSHNGSVYTSAFGPYPMVIHANGQTVTLNFMNDDGQSHEIHSDSGTFGHDPGSIGAHALDPFVRHLPAAPAQYDWYLHGDPNGSNIRGQMIFE